MAQRYVLIGAGPSVSAAQAIRGADPDGDITVVCEEANGYYSRPGLAYYLADEVPESQLCPFKELDFCVGARRVTAQATRIRPAEHVVELEGAPALSYDRLLIATGSEAIMSPATAGGLKGIVKLDNLDDARNIVYLTRSARRAVMVGGGITALEIVEGLCARKVRTHYFMRRDRYWSNVLSPAESRIIESGLKAQGVEIHYFTELAEIIGKRGQVAGVRTEKGEEIPCEMVAVAIGVLPRKALGEAAGLRTARGIIVDEYLRTTDPDIFAAGDVAEVCEPLTDKYNIDILWSSAVAKGWLAGHNMAAPAPKAYDKGIPVNVTRLAGLTVTIMGTVGKGKDADLPGIARGDSEAWRQLTEATEIEWDRGRDHVRLLLSPNRLLGAIVMGHQEPSIPLHRLIANQVDMSSAWPALREPAAPVGELLTELWKRWRREHDAAKS